MAEKKGLIYRMTMGRDDNPDFTIEKLPTSRWAMFRDILSTRFGTLFKINLLMILFMLPAFAWLILTMLAQIAEGSFINYTGNIGIGYPFEPNAVVDGLTLNFYRALQTNLILIPLLLIASLGLAGGFHCIKMIVWGENISVASAFFKGIKTNAIPFLWGTLVLALGLWLVQLNFAAYGLFTPAGKFLSVLALVASVIVLILLIFMGIFIYTQAVTYHMKFIALLRNSFIFAIGMVIPNTFFVGICAIPALIMIFSSLQISLFMITFYVIIGLSITVLIITLYTHYVFDRFLNDKIEGAIKDRAVYSKSKEEKERIRKEAEERKKKAVATQKYVNPKKKKPQQKKTPDVEITPLSQSFSRQDLMKLAEQKKALAQDSEEDANTNIDESDNSQQENN